MPLFLVEIDNQPARLIYGKTRRGVQSYALKTLRERIVVQPVSPLEAAILAKGGTEVETIAGTTTHVAENDPPEARRRTPAAEGLEHKSDPVDIVTEEPTDDIPWSPPSDESLRADDEFLAGDPQQGVALRDI